MSKLYAGKHAYDQAIEYAKIGLTLNNHLSDRIELYEMLSSFYKEKQELDVVIAYKDSVIIAKDTLSKRINHQLFQSNKIKFNIEEYKNRIMLQKQEEEANQKVFWLIIISLLIILFFFYRWNKVQIIKKEQEKKMAENQQQIIQLELEKEKNNQERIKAQSIEKEQRLKNKIAEKNRRLSARALYISDRNRLIEEIMEKLTENEEIKSNKKLMQIIHSLRQHLKTDNDWGKFFQHFEQINPSFFKNLKTKHPDLNNQDIRFLCYLYMNLDIKEIGIVLGITLDACRKRKQRIATKMDISTSHLRDYVKSLFFDENPE